MAQTILFQFIGSQTIGQCETINLDGVTKAEIADWLCKKLPQHAEDIRAAAAKPVTEDNAR